MPPSRNVLEAYLSSSFVYVAYVHTHIPVILARMLVVVAEAALCLAAGKRARLQCLLRRSAHNYPRIKRGPCRHLLLVLLKKWRLGTNQGERVVGTFICLCAFECLSLRVCCAGFHT